MRSNNLKKVLSIFFLLLLLSNVSWADSGDMSKIGSYHMAGDGEALPLKWKTDQQGIPFIDSINFDYSKVKKAKVNNVSDVVKFINEAAAVDILRIFTHAHVSYPAKYVELKIYKREALLELIAGENKAASKIVARFPICAMDFVPGPKLQVGDERTPEGVFSLRLVQNSRNWWMWMDLRNLDQTGAVGVGNSFYFCTDYPHKSDISKSQSIGIKNPGGSICIHGNCVTAGCPSLENWAFATIFAITMGHDSKKFGTPKVTIYPFVYDADLNLKDEAEKAAAVNGNTKKLGATNIEKEWQTLFEINKSDNEK